MHPSLEHRNDTTPVGRVATHLASSYCSRSDLFFLERDVAGCGRAALMGDGSFGWMV